MQINGRVVNFLSDVKFKAIRDTLDALMKESTRLGMRVGHRQSEIITPEMENILWSKRLKRLLGDHNPETLLNTLAYAFGLYFALYGRNERRTLRYCPSQMDVSIWSIQKMYKKLTAADCISLEVRQN